MSLRLKAAFRRMADTEITFLSESEERKGRLNATAVKVMTPVASVKGLWVRRRPLAGISEGGDRTANRDGFQFLPEDIIKYKDVFEINNTHRIVVGTVKAGGTWNEADEWEIASFTRASEYKGFYVFYLELRNQFLGGRSA